MDYKYLSEIGESYNNEENASGHRFHALTALENKLKQAIVDLKTLEKGRPGIASATTKSVKDLANFHLAQQQPARELNLNEAREKVARYTKWLTLQGARVDKDGTIDWGVSDRTVVYDHDLTKKGMTMVRFYGGRLFTDDALKVPLNTANMVTHFSGPGKAIYVMSNTGNIHVGSHSVGYRHHSSLLAGANVAGAGELETNGNGALTWLSNKSGHYTPTIGHLLQVLHQIQKKGVPMTFKLSVLSQAGKKEYGTVGDFLSELQLNGEPDYELMKLFAYSNHLTDDALLSKNGWRWRHPHEQPGVYVMANNTMVPHKQVRQWLKSQGKLADIEKQPGTGR